MSRQRTTNIVLTAIAIALFLLPVYTIGRSLVEQFGQVDHVPKSGRR